MNPYDGLPATAFWKACVGRASEHEAGYDAGLKFRFAPVTTFATAGSCFAQHFARRLAACGGRVVLAEGRHPLVPEDRGHGYGVFSARYGNLYTARQLRELLEQALGHREPVRDFALREDGRWVDLLRPRAVPMGFASREHARADRDYHLQAVRAMVGAMDVLVFTLGLTEGWENAAGGYAYPVAPGTAAGDFDPARHRFFNSAVMDVVADLERTVAIVREANPRAHLLLTVSPVGLVATMEKRSVLVSTSASKSILRAAADEVVRSHPAVDYFPSYEIVTGAPARGRYWAEGLREVTAAGVEAVMDVFLRSRLPDLPSVAPTPAATPAAPASALDRALEAECDERFLDRS